MHWGFVLGYTHTRCRLWYILYIYTSPLLGAVFSDCFTLFSAFAMSSQEFPYPARFGFEIWVALLPDSIDIRDTRCHRRPLLLVLPGLGQLLCPPLLGLGQLALLGLAALLGGGLAALDLGDALGDVVGLELLLGRHGRPRVNGRPVRRENVLHDVLLPRRLPPPRGDADHVALPHAVGGVMDQVVVRVFEGLRFRSNCQPVLLHLLVAVEMAEGRATLYGRGEKGLASK